MPLSPAEARLHSALNHYLEIIRQGRAESQNPSWAEILKQSMRALEILESELAPNLDPRVLHFLESKSYRKAHDYLSALSSSGLVNPTTPRQARQR